MSFLKLHDGTIRRPEEVLAAFILCMGAWLIRASVMYDGKVVLEGSTSDDGRTDADGVWEQLKQITFKPTADFAALGIDPTAKQTVLTDGRKGVPLSQTKLRVDIVYGG